jgi:hypothetical protein
MLQPPRNSSIASKSGMELFGGSGWWLVEHSSMVTFEDSALIQMHPNRIFSDTKTISDYFNHPDVPKITIGSFNNWSMELFGVSMELYGY